VWPVQLKIAADGGVFESCNFDATFKRLPQSRIDEIVDGIREEKVTNLDFCNEVLLGWKGILDSERNEVPFSESAKAELLDTPGMCNAISLAFFESVSGQKRKN
jgi:hypothetical protein